MLTAWTFCFLGAKIELTELSQNIVYRGDQIYLLKETKYSNLPHRLDFKKIGVNIVLDSYTCQSISYFKVL